MGMERAVLMSTHEPSDRELGVLMHDVANEAKKKATTAKQQLNESISLEIQKARLKYDALQETKGNLENLLWLDGQNHSNG